jgi:HEAT repeat protein
MSRTDRVIGKRWPRPASALALALLLGAGPAWAGEGDRSGQQVAFEEVVANLKVGDPRVRLDSLRLLREAGFLESAVPVAALITAPGREVPLAAIDTVVSIYLADEAYTRQYAGGVVKQRGASLALLAFAQGPGALVPNPVPREVVANLVAALDSSLVDVRFNAMYALGVFAPSVMKQGPLADSAKAAERLIAAAKDSDPNLRLAATHTLGRLLDAAAVGKGQPDLAAARTEAGDQIVAGMNDPDPLIRSASIRALGAMRYERAVQGIIDQLGYYKKGPEARELLDALARIAHPSSVSFFSALLDNADEQIRRLAVEGIGRAGDENAFYNLEIRTSKEKSKYVRQALAFLRARRGEAAAFTPLMEGFRDAGLGRVAWAYLLELGSPAGATLASFATHQDWRVRAATAEALGVIGHTAGVTAVEDLARDKNKNVRGAAERSLLRLTPRPAGTPRAR